MAKFSEAVGGDDDEDAGGGDGREDGEEGRAATGRHEVRGPVVERDDQQWRHGDQQVGHVQPRQGLSAGNNENIQ